MAKVLVVGGAGYVGSSTCAWLKDTGHDVWVLDDLTTGYRELVLTDHFVHAKAGDTSIVAPLLKKEKFDCIMYFAARSLVGESLQKPEEYFQNNVLQTRAFLQAALEAGSKNLVFSSTCAIFSNPDHLESLSESTPKKPMNPYGATKLQIEKDLERLAQEQGLRAIALRYFNAAGAEPELRVGERHEPETHLIPRVLQSVRQNQSVEIYGDQYPTPDGTCIRDYIHVWDLARAHEIAMNMLLQKQKTQASGYFDAFNLGSERGFSVREVVKVCEEVTGVQLKIRHLPPREGDPARLVADSSRARELMGFITSHSSLKNIIQSAWEWEQRRPNPLRAGVFLDRDGTINEDPGYLNDPSQLKLLPEVGEALSRLKQAGYTLIVVSNQSGVGRGLIQKDNLTRIHQRLDELLQPWSVSIDHFELCFHHPNEDCECRKPKPKLIVDAAKLLNVNLSKSYMIGDKASDLDAGNSAGCQASILVRTGEGAKVETELQKMPNKKPVAFIADSLLQAANWILSRENVNF